MALDRQFTLREIELLCPNTPVRIQFRMMWATNHTTILGCVEDAIDWIAIEFSKTAQHRFNLDEDTLTVDLVGRLSGMGFDASHDKDYGGHADIIIEAKYDFLWIGEAKIHRDYEWLMKGFQQLDTRYSTGLPGQDDGGLIIYCKGERADLVMARWVEYLTHERPDVTVSDCVSNPLIMRSTHTHRRTGLPFRVRHLAVSIYFNPRDARGARG